MENTIKTNNKDSIIFAKAKFISLNKNKLFNNISMMSYPLYKILSSDKSLSEIEEYEMIKNYLNKVTSAQSFYSEDLSEEKYILQIIASYIDKMACSLEEKENFRNNMICYDEYFEEPKTKVAKR